jgi:hypothetical protein
MHDRAPVLGLIHPGVNPDMVAVGGGWDVIGWAVVNDPDMGRKVMKNVLNHATHHACEHGHDNMNPQPIRLWKCG